MKGVQRSYKISRAGVSVRFASRAQRQKRLRELVDTMNKEVCMWAGRVRAHQVRMREYGIERLILIDLVKEDAQ